MTIGKLRRVPLREVWKHEAADFTTWLEGNVDVLNDVLDMSITNVEREKDAGDFSVDLVGEDESGGTVVIENQLEASNHDHLGKVLTYLAALDAKAAIWIVARARTEHVRAIAWLNEATATPFYLVQVEAVIIGESAPAPLFTLIAGPSAEARAAGETKKDLSTRHLKRQEFWTLLLDVARNKTRLHANISPTVYHWVSGGSGTRGITFNYAVQQHECRVELYIDVGDQVENKATFDTLSGAKAEIDAAFGAPLEWLRLEAKRASAIRYTLPGGWKDEPDWPKITEALSDAMVKLEAALRPHLRKLKSA